MGNESKEPWANWEQDFQGLGRGWGQAEEWCLSVGYESEPSTAPAPLSPPPRAPSASVPAQHGPAEAHTSNLSPLPALGEVERVGPRLPGSSLPSVRFSVPLQPLSGLSLCVTLSPLCFAVITARIPDEAATSVCARAQALCRAPAHQLFPGTVGPWCPYARVAAPRTC